MARLWREFRQLNITDTEVIQLYQFPRETQKMLY